MKVEMNNMGFGEFIRVFPNKSDKFITIDCGSISKSKYKAIAFSKLSIDEPIMITHLHDDHMNYFVEYAKKHGKFKKVYLPLITTNNNGFGFITILSKAIVDWMLLKKSPISYEKNFLNKIIQIRELFTKYSDIVFLHKGIKFKYGTLDIDVLWPDSNLIVNFGKIYEIIKSEILLFLDNNNATIDNSYWVMITQIAKTNLDFYSGQLGDGALKNKIEIYNENLKKLKGILIINKSKIIYKKAKANINDLSIVCEITENGKKALFTGDINYSRVKRMASKAGVSFSLENKDYALCKIPHHGTENYINCFKKVNANEFIVSNGNHKRYCIGKSINCYVNLECTNGITNCNVAKKTCCLKHKCCCGTIIKVI